MSEKKLPKSISRERKYSSKSGIRNDNPFLMICPEFCLFLKDCFMITLVGFKCFFLLLVISWIIYLLFNQEWQNVSITLCKLKIHILFVIYEHSNNVYELRVIPDSVGGG